MSAALEARGLKRVCSECGGRFYDLNKRPITCPSCQTEFTGEMKVKNRRGRAAVSETSKVQEDELEVANDETDIESDSDVVSLNDLDEGDDGDEESADLENIEDEDLGDLGKDLGDLDAGIDMDEDDEDLDADLGDVKRSGDE